MSYRKHTAGQDSQWLGGGHGVETLCAGGCIASQSGRIHWSAGLVVSRANQPLQSLGPIGKENAGNFREGRANGWGVEHFLSLVSQSGHFTG